MYINDHFSQAKYLYNAYLKDNLTPVCTVIYIDLEADFWIREALYYCLSDIVSYEKLKLWAQTQQLKLFSSSWFSHSSTFFLLVVVQQCSQYTLSRRLQ